MPYLRCPQGKPFNTQQLHCFCVVLFNTTLLNVYVEKEEEEKEEKEKNHLLNFIYYYYYNYYLYFHFI